MTWIWLGQVKMNSFPYGMYGNRPPMLPNYGYSGDPYMQRPLMPWTFPPNATIVDTVPQEMRYMVPDHWYRFPPINPLWYSLLGVTMIVLGSISITGNGIVLYLMTSVKSLRTPTNILICNLAFSDFMMMAFNMTTMAINSFAQTWALGPFMYVSPIFVSSFHLSITTLIHFFIQIEINLILIVLLL